MAKLILRAQDYNNRNGITNLAPATANGQPVVYEQMNAAIEGISWKDNVRVASQVNVTIASPGAAIDGITLTTGDRILIKSQTSPIENGIYAFNGSATPLTRCLDASTFDELESAITTVDEGTNAGVSYRQTQVNGIIDTNNIVWVNFISASPAASTSTPGIIQIATQPIVDAGTDNAQAVTPLTLATYSGKAKRYSTTFGDGSATSYVITHNLGTTDFIARVSEVAGSKRDVDVEIQHTSTTTATVLFDVAPASNAYRITILA